MTGTPKTCRPSLPAAGAREPLSSTARRTGQAPALPPAAAGGLAGPLLSQAKCLARGHRPSWWLASQRGVTHAAVCRRCLRPVTTAASPAATGDAA